MTEVVTGVDIVRSQIQIAQGHHLHRAPMSLPKQDQIAVNGYALQCRVTTEDPSNNFIPDYGKIHTYRSPAGFGIRLDGGSAYGGATITPYYDSLLVKITAWGRGFDDACQRMDRALREFRIRGVKTNIPFLENVVNHPKFQAGDVTTSFLEQNPALFRYTSRRDRATRLLTYLGDVIVNGNPEVAGKKRPEKRARAVAPASPGGDPPPGTRQLLQKLRRRRVCPLDQPPEAPAADRHDLPRRPSIAARDARPHLRHAGDRGPYVAHRLSNLYSLEMWGGATFDVSMRYLIESPWMRLRRLRELIPNICFQMLLRASNAVGYTAYPDNVVREFVYKAAEEGHRHLPHFRLAELAAQHARRHGRGEEDRRGLRSRDVLHRRHSRSEADQVFARLLRQDGEGAGAHGRRHHRHQGYGGPAEALCGRDADYGAARRGRHADPLPHARHQRDQRGLHPQGLRRGRPRRRLRHRQHERHDQPAQSQLGGRRAGAHAARHGPRSRRAERLLRLLGGGPRELRAVRHRAFAPARPRSTSTRCRAASSPI